MAAEEPTRLRDLPAAYDVSGVGASDLFRAASTLPRLSDAEVELALRRLRSVTGRPRWASLRWSFSLASLPVLMFGLTVGAATTVMVTHHLRPQAPAETSAVPTPEPPKPRPRHLARALSIPQPPEAPLQSSTPLANSGGEPGPLSVRSLVPKRKPSRAPVASAPIEVAPALAAEEPVAPPAADVPSWALPPSQEIQMLQQAVRALRVEGRPAIALDLLQGFSQKHPNSTLLSEAALLQVETQMVLGQRSEALAALNALRLKQKLPVEFVVLRAELLAAHNRCAEALPAFDALPSTGVTSTLQERSLYGRAVCLAKQGQTNEARAAYESYRQRFPKGRFIQSVSRALSGLHLSPPR